MGTLLQLELYCENLWMVAEVKANRKFGLCILGRIIFLN